MKKLEKFTLSKNNKDQSWDLKKDSSKEVVKKFETKEKATVGGALSGDIGSNGGCVKIKKRMVLSRKKGLSRGIRIRGHREANVKAMNKNGKFTIIGSLFIPTL